MTWMFRPSCESWDKTGSHLEDLLASGPSRNLGLICWGSLYEAARGPEAFLPDTNLL